MIRTNQATASLALTLCLLMGPLSSATSTPRVHVLAGITKIETSTTSSVLVRFPRPVDFRSEFESWHEGAGRVRGFILRRLGDTSKKGIDRPF